MAAKIPKNYDESHQGRENNRRKEREVIGEKRKRRRRREKENEGKRK